MVAHMWMLKQIKAMRSIRRRIFGDRVPEWLTEPIKLVKYFDLIRLLPTLYMIVFAPAHFFKCLPAIRKEKKPYYLTPLQFVTNSAALQVVLLTFMFPDGVAMSKETLFLYNVVVVITSPVLIACTCIVVLILWFFCAHIWPINHLANELPFNHHGALIPLSPSTYINLDGGRYFWSLFYYYLYFYCMLLLIGAGFALAEILIWDVYSSIGNKIYINKVTIIPFALVGLVAAIVGYWVLVRPYILLLLQSSRRLTRRMVLFIYSDAQS